MGKIVGNFLILCFGLVTGFVEAGITMEIRTENGVKNQVVVGQPFVLDVIIDDVYGSVQTPMVKGLNNFASRQSGSYMSSINGRSTARYSYQVRIDTLGSYLLGPAVVTHQQQELVSNQVRVDVVKDIGVAPQNSNAQGNESKAFLRLMVNSETVVVGQKVGCILRFYYQDPSISLHNVAMPSLSSFDIKEVGKLEQGTAEVDGIEYRYAQWQWDMYPTKPGEFIIPAYNADYEIPLKDNHMLGGFFAFVANRAERKRVYSNAVTVRVSPLPHCNHPVHAVGTFERFSAEIKPGMAKVGEGMVLVLEIEGSGNLEAIAVPTLQLPKALKYYDSHTAIIPSQYSDEFPKKRFEFIVQGIDCGDCEIPEQLFTYFDIDRNAYTTLRTSPLAISIMPGAHSVKKDISMPVEIVAQDSTELVVQESIADINAVGEWYPVDDRQPLPWWIFQLLFLMPCMYVGYPRIIEKFISLTGSSVRLRRLRAFRKARKEISQAAKTADNKKLYAIFMQLFQELNTVPQLDGWNDFFERITHAAYAQSDTNNSDELCRMAKQWLERLEKVM